MCSKSLSDYPNLMAASIRSARLRKPFSICTEVLVSDPTSSKFHQIPDALWERIDLVLPIFKPSRKGGRPRLPMRNVVTGIFYVLATGSQWKAMPKQFGSGSDSCVFSRMGRIRRFQELWELALTEYDELKGIDWEWQSMDGAMTKSPLGGKKLGKTRPIAASWA